MIEPVEVSRMVAAFQDKAETLHITWILKMNGAEVFRRGMLYRPGQNVEEGPVMADITMPSPEVEANEMIGVDTLPTLADRCTGNY